MLLFGDNMYDRARNHWCFLPEDVVPKYTPPMPVNLPLLDPQTWTAFTLNTILQTAGVSMYDTHLTGFNSPFLLCTILPYSLIVTKLSIK